MDVEHLWHYNDQEAQKHSEHSSSSSSSNASSSSGAANNNNPDFLSNLCNIADHRLYRLVKWCKSLPLFKNISVSTLTPELQSFYFNFDCFVTRDGMSGI